MNTHKKSPMKALSPLEKTVPKSKKYEHIEGKLDTGLTIYKVKSISNHEYAKRRDEIFFRITKNQLYELYNEYEVDDYEDIAEVGGSGKNDDNSPTIVTYLETSKPVYEKPYLILDVRDKEQFEVYHMLQARSYPFVLMRRDIVHPELPKFKNKEGVLVVVVCDDDRIGCEASKLLVDRGTDNVYYLTGGINEFAAYYPSFMEGIIPDSIGSPKRSIPQIRSDAKSTKQNMTPRSDKVSVSSGKFRAPKYGDFKSNSPRKRGGSETMSNATGMSVAESIISRASSRKGKY